MSATSELDLQKFYPKELEITSIEETQDELWLHMRSRGKSYQCLKCCEKLCQLHALITEKYRNFQY